MKLKVLPILSLGLFLLSGFSSKGQGYVHADSLKGFLNAERACYDVGFYHLSLQINPADKSISGDVRIDFTAIQDFKTLQLDLWHNLELDSIVWQEITVKSIREHDAIHVTFPVELTAGSRHSIRVYYHGHPVEAANPPWNGGFTWAEDSEGNPWVSMSCEGEGASIWWACKDHFSDEPDSVRITAIVPAGLTAVGNGRPIGVYDTGALWTAFEWRVRNPINVYDVNITLGKMAHFSDHFNGAEGPLDLEYYVLSYTLDKAKKHFEQVKPMMACYEQHFGPYPFMKILINLFRLLSSVWSINRPLPMVTISKEDIWGLTIRPLVSIILLSMNQDTSGLETASLPMIRPISGFMNLSPPMANRFMLNVCRIIARLSII